MLVNVGIVVLNYLICEETEEMLASLKKHYPGVRTVIVDNGSPEPVVQRLGALAKQYKNVSLVKLDTNTGFARGNNAGIKMLREEGYDYICCINSDVIITEGAVLENLIKGLVSDKAAIAGPRVITPTGEDQNPLRVTRPGAKEAKQIFNEFNSFRSKRRLKYLLPVWLFKVLLLAKKLFVNVFLSKKNKTGFKPGQAVENKSSLPPGKQEVYSLQGSFLMMGPEFFRYYDGFDEHTFLYVEEDILAEMMLARGLKSVYVPECAVLHKHGQTINNLWRDKIKTGKIKFKYIRESVKHWYLEHYLKNSSV